MDECLCLLCGLCAGAAVAGAAANKKPHPAPHQMAPAGYANQYPPGYPHGHQGPQGQGYPQGYGAPPPQQIQTYNTAPPPPKPYPETTVATGYPVASPPVAPHVQQQPAATLYANVEPGERKDDKMSVF